MKISSLSSYLPSSVNIPRAAKILIGTAAAVATLAALRASYQAATWVSPATLPAVFLEILPTPPTVPPLDKRLVLGATVAALGYGVFFTALTGLDREELASIKGDLRAQDEQARTLDERARVRYKESGAQLAALERSIAFLTWSTNEWLEEQQRSSEEQQRRLNIRVPSNRTKD